MHAISRFSFRIQDFGTRQDRRKSQPRIFFGPPN
jgi:hypothetical protein